MRGGRGGEGVNCDDIFVFGSQFGDNQKLRLLRILRSSVMVRVGGGWEPLEEFLRKHDPCRGRLDSRLAYRLA